MSNMQEIHAKFLQSTGVSTDTRQIHSNCFFVALKGAQFNGNHFAAQALEQGAAFAMIDEPQPTHDERFILVDDCLKALQDLANYHRKQFSIPVIGITGSNGKTSTKELINAVLSQKYEVLATIGNLNNHIGVPLTLMRMKPSHEIAIIEMGANRFKDIEELCNIAEPTHGIITNIGKAHLEGFLNFEGVLKTKLELYQAVDQVKGELFVNGDDPILMDNLPKQAGVQLFGKNASYRIAGQLERLTPFVELSWKKKDYQAPEIKTNLVGEYNFYNFLAALCIGDYFNVEPSAMNKAIETYVPTNNRSQVQKSEKNTLIVDCYNANPSSMASALQSFVQIETANKCLILGDMKEMGAEEEKEHLKIIEFVNENKLSAFFVGPVFSKMALGGQKGFASTADLIEYLKNNPLSDHLVLLKGSRGIALEQTIPYL
jgi:UDP-N-acetylmuramoyl-tripeptide--D-alanyl-D-alanine ligase